MALFGKRKGEHKSRTSPAPRRQSQDSREEHGFCLASVKENTSHEHLQHLGGSLRTRGKSMALFGKRVIGDAACSHSKCRYASMKKP
jgi:hypothetical protein